MGIPSTRLVSSAKLLRNGSRSREAMEEILQEAKLFDLGWNKIEQSGATKMMLAKLKEAAAQPDAFLRQAVVISPTLMRCACAARATSQRLPLDEQALAQMNLKPFLRSQVAVEAVGSACLIHDKPIFGTLGIYPNT